MKGLWIVFAGKRLDRLGVECVRAEIDGLADAEEGVEAHAPASRVRNMTVFSSSKTLSPRWLTISLRKVTRPSWGRDFERRLATTPVLPESVSPASTGFFHLTWSM